VSYSSQSNPCIEELLCRLRPKGPNKHHILEALSTLGAFTRLYRKKVNLAARQRNAAAATSQAGTSNLNAGQPKSTNRNKTRDRTTPDSSRYGATSSTFPKIPGGMEDVD
jgi:hypothetical protein